MSEERVSPVAIDAPESQQLLHRLRRQGVAGILVTALVISGIACFQFYQSQKQSTIEYLRSDLQIGALALSATLKDYQSIARQVTGRTHIRQMLQQYNLGKIAAIELRRETEAVLSDAMRQAPEIVGITRLDANGMPVAQVGETIPQAAWPKRQEASPLALGLPLWLQQSTLFAISASITNHKQQRLGTDLVFFDMTKSVEIVERLSQQFEFASWIQFVARGAEGAQYFNLSQRDLINPLQPRASLIDQQMIGSGNHEVHNLHSERNPELTLLHLSVPNTNWQMVLAAASSDVYASAGRNTWLLFAAMMVLLFAGTFATHAMGATTLKKITLGDQALRELNQRNQELLNQALSNKRLIDDVLDHSVSVIFIKNLEGKYLHVNRAFADERGMDGADIIGRTDYDLHAADVAEMLRENDRKAVRSDGPVMLEETLMVKGRQRVFLTTKFPLRDHENRIYATCGMATDTTEIKKNEELKFALDAAESANQSKSVFLANMSHELRTPLHGILSFSERGMERIDRVQKEKLFKYFENIQVSGKRLLSLLNDLLDLSKLEAGKFELNYKTCSLSDIIDDCVVEQSPAINQAALKIVQVAGEVDKILECDPERIHQVIRNLLSNAIKFSPGKAVIEFEFDDCQIYSGENLVDAIELRIRDEGKGINQEELNAIFDKFHQSQNPVPGGTGLGLSICREIVNLHRGNIWAENRQPDGAMFVIRLPRKMRTASQ